MFSAVLGLGTSLLGGLSANAQFEAEMAMRNRELQEMRNQRTFNQYMGYMANKERQEENEYLRELEQMNRLVMEQERQFQIDQMMWNRDVLTEERQYQIDRQMEQDREAARVQAMRLEQMLRNEGIAQEERAFAEQQLAYVQAVASGEREEDMRRFYEEQARAEQQREFLMGEFSTARDAMADDRARDLAMHDQLTGQIGDMTRALRMAEIELGAVPELPRLTKADLDAEIARRQDQYMSDVDRAADRVGSVNEANLIRAGLDASTPGTAARGDITRRIADEYSSARARAYDDALRYISGEQDFLMAGHSGEMDRRRDILSEVASVEGAGLEQLMNLPNVRSMAGAFEMAKGVPAGIYTRGISSANNFNAPVGMGTAMYNDQIARGLSDYTVGRTATQQDHLGIVSQIYGPNSMSLLNPGSFYDAAANIQGNIFSAVDASSQRAGNNAADAWGTFGTELGGFLQDYGGDISDLFGDWGIG